MTIKELYSKLINNWEQYPANNDFVISPNKQIVISKNSCCVVHKPWSNVNDYDWQGLAGFNDAEIDIDNNIIVLNKILALKYA